MIDFVEIPTKMNQKYTKKSILSEFSNNRKNR